MFNLRRMLEGMGAQANPFDGGKTFSSVNKKPAQARPMMGRPAGGAGGSSRDNQITNQMVAQGRLPRNQAEVYQQPQLQVSNFGGYGQANYRGYEDFPTPAVQSTQQAEITQPGWSPSLQGAQQYFTGQLTRAGASLQGMQGQDTGDYRRFTGY